MTPTQRADTRTEETSWVIEVTYPEIGKWVIVHKQFGGQSSSETEDNMIPTTLEACVEAFQIQLSSLKKYLMVRDNHPTRWRARNVMTDEIITIDALTC